LRELIAVGKMPTILELHLTEADRDGYHQLRRRYLRDSTALPKLTFLGQYLRQLDATSDDLTSAEQGLTQKLQVYADLVGSGRVDLIALDDQARGRESLDNAVAAEILSGLGVDPACILANIVARNRFPDQVRSRLKHFADLGIVNALLLTGDLPVDAARKAVFPLDSIGMCELARQMIIDGDLPEDFLIAAAGHPNVDADPDGLRTFQKALAGARVIITQAIYDVDAFTAWMESLRRLGALDMVHVLGEVIPLTSSRQLEIIREVPGMRVPDDLIEELNATEARIDSLAAGGKHDQDWISGKRALEGSRITRTILHRIRRVPGVSGFYLGCIKSFAPHLELLRETPLVPDHAEGLHKRVKLSGAERQMALAQLPVIETRLKALRERVAGKDGWLGQAGEALARSSGFCKALKVLEWPKVPIFGCHQCDQCDLSVDALVCPRGCAKQMSHGPCGAPRKDGDKILCEDTSRECTWGRINDRRDAVGTSFADRLASRTAPDPEFFQGRSFSAVAPVLAGKKSPPDWKLGYRAPAAALQRWLRPGYRRQPSDSPHELATLVASRTQQIEKLLHESPAINREELLIKSLALVGTPQAIHLIETQMAQLGIPAEGSLADLSIREQFLLAEALPLVRERMLADKADGKPPLSPLARCDELLRVIPRGKLLRRAMRRELANGLIQHIASLGVRVTYANVLLLPVSVESFLQALTILKDELQVFAKQHRIEQGMLSVHFDRVHYRHHFRRAISVRRFCSEQEDKMGRSELVIDIKQFQSAGFFRAETRKALHALASREDAESTITLETFADESRSLTWAFNAEFWKRLGDFEAATGIKYDESIGGSSDHNLAYVRSTARAYFDRIHENNLGHEPLYVMEIGVASVTRAEAFLDELKRICTVSNVDYHERTTYLLADFSEDLLEKGKAELSRHHGNVESVRFDAADPASALRRYQGRIMHAHICNVYDNLPADKVAWINGTLYRMESRLQLSESRLRESLEPCGLDAADLDWLRQQLGELKERGTSGVATMLDGMRERLTASGRPASDYVHAWMALFQAMTLEERYLPVEDPADESPALDLGADLTCPQLMGATAQLLRGRSDMQVHLNQQAISGFVKLLPLLHPSGTLEVVDIFARRLDEYEQRHKGPAKYDGSTVNWLNGPLFRAVGEALGYDIRFNSFKPFDPKSASVIMLARKA
jgi:5,10-methylenetetrahydrofolate reductase